MRPMARKARPASDGVPGIPCLLVPAPPDGVTRPRARQGRRRIHNARMGPAPAPHAAPARAPVQSTRDRGITAVVEGFFAIVWFGWGQAHAPASLATWLYVGQALALVVAVTGAVVVLRSPKSTGAVGARESGARYGIVVGVEFTLAGLGAGLLGGFGQADYIPVWVCAVVGVHFFALVSLLRDRMLIWLGLLMCVVAMAALVGGVAHETAPSTVTGVGAGGLLLVFGSVALAGIPAGRRAGRWEWTP